MKTYTCPKCGHSVSHKSFTGMLRTPAKARASRKNGKKGGRPRKLRFPPAFGMISTG